MFQKYTSLTKYYYKFVCINSLKQIKIAITFIKDH